MPNWTLVGRIECDNGKQVKWQVPQGVSALKLRLRGGGGGGTLSGSGVPGQGGIVKAEVHDVLPEEIVTIVVGCQGQDGNGETGGSGGPGARMGGNGGNGINGAGGGGGSTAVIFKHGIIVIGGGGGASYFQDGGSGGQIGDNGNDQSAGGRGATPNGPGMGGTAPSGKNGENGHYDGGGGNGAIGANRQGEFGGGGGGAGYRGGGGGAANASVASVAERDAVISGGGGGGGGGSGYAASLFKNVIFETGGNNGDGNVEIFATYFRVTETLSKEKVALCEKGIGITNTLYVSGFPHLSNLTATFSIFHSTEQNPLKSFTVPVTSKDVISPLFIPQDIGTYTWITYLQRRGIEIYKTERGQVLKVLSGDLALDIFMCYSHELITCSVKLKGTCSQRGFLSCVLSLDDAEDGEKSELMSITLAAEGDATHKLPTFIVKKKGVYTWKVTFVTKSGSQSVSSFQSVLVSGVCGCFHFLM